MAVHLASLSTPLIASPKLVPSTKAGFKPWSTSLVRCEPRAEGCSRSAAQRRPSRYQPSTWNYDFIQSITCATSIETQRTRVEELRREVRQIITSTTEQVAQLELIDSLERLGVAYHFESEIRRSLDAISTSTRGFEDLYSSSLRFRILRQYGYNVYAECFSRFRDQSSLFFENLREDVRGLLSLYEASQLACEGEIVLEEASAFSSEHLRARISRMDQRMSRQVQRALQVPLHRGVLQSESDIINLSSMIVHLLADLWALIRKLAPVAVVLGVVFFLLSAQQQQQHTVFSRSFSNVALNIERVSQCMYDYEDGVSVFEHESMDRVHSHIAKPIQTA
ncbi:hypothetical protein EJ110_NYTH22351 [Nymphaea thermarum]|nr:hypothetical protein EJ110_NYTH22351 [Nymphaea thermarum]